MSEWLRDREHQRLCDVLRSVSPDAPTLCEGWTAHDMAVHVWTLHNDPLSWPGLGVPALAGYTAKRMEAVKQRWSYEELVERVRSQPPGPRCMPGDHRENYRHALGEYYVHSQDILRANDLHVDPPDEALEEALWQRVQRAALALHVMKPYALRLDHPDGRRARITGWPRRKALTVKGLPSELMCWTYGRQPADVVVAERR